MNNVLTTSGWVSLFAGISVVIGVLIYIVYRHYRPTVDENIVELKRLIEPAPQSPSSRQSGWEDGANLPFPSGWMTATLLFFAILLYLSLATFSRVDIFGGVSLGQIVIGLLVGYLILSIRLREVKETEMGVLSFFGRPIMEVRSGPVFAPPGIVKVIPLPVGTFQRELPAPKEMIERHDDTPLGPGMKRAIRAIHPESEDAIYGTNPDGTLILWKDLEEEDQMRIKADPLGRRAATEIIFNLRLRIRSGITFIRAVGSMDEALRQAEDALFQAAQSILGTMTPGYALTQLPRVNEELRKALEVLTGERPYVDNLGNSRLNRSWGVDIQDSGIKELSLGQTINDELAHRNAALATKERTITTAEGAKQAAILQAEGSKKVTILGAEGEAAATVLNGRALALSLKARGEQVATEGGRAILIADTFSAFDKSRLVVASGEGGLTGIVSMVKEALKSE